MSQNYKISDSTKMWMLSLAAMFDLIQFLTPRIFDTLITVTAALVFMMIFIEKGAIVPRASGALKIARIVLPVAEIIYGNLPTIFLTVWIQIKISRMVDEVVPEEAQELIRARRLPAQMRQIKNHKKFIKSRSKKLAQMQASRYGKGRRGVATAMRQNAQNKADRLNTNKI